jgi:hypothetical protein
VIRTPILFAESFLSRTQFPAHVITASSEATGREAWRVGTGRRGALNSWRAAAAGDGWIEVDCYAQRTADMIAVDRGHSLAGKRIVLTCDGATVLDLVVPGAATRPGDVDAAAGCCTEEGAWLQRFTATTGRVWRLSVYAGGDAAHRPEIRGLYLGASWQLSEFADLPYSDSEYELAYRTAVTDALWMGASAIAQRRQGTLRIKLHSSAEIPTAEYHVRHLFGRRRPMWIVHDPLQAARAVLAEMAPGSGGLRREEGWFLPQADLAWIEREPAQ